MNISSVIISTKTPDETAALLEKISGVEVHLKSENTIIAVIEAADINEEIALLREIEQTKGILAANLHYSYFEDELKDEITSLNHGVPKVLNDDTPAESIKYYGNVNSLIK